MTGLCYDTGALLSAEADDRAVWALHARALQRGALPVVPVGVLAQAWRGGPQPSLSRFLRGCRVEPMDEARSREAGALCARSHTSDVVDASVVASALSRGDLVVTSDPLDLRRIASGLRRKLAVQRV